VDLRIGWGFGEWNVSGRERGRLYFSEVTMVRKRGFTLVELLVVVAIIALLIAILLPSLGRAKNTAKRAQCAATLKNWGTAVFAYGVEWENKIMCRQPWSGGLSWAALYADQLNKLNTRVRVCPSELQPPAGAPSSFRQNYFFVRFVPKPQQMWVISNIKNPSMKLMMTDAAWNNGTGFLSSVNGSADVLIGNYSSFGWAAGGPFNVQDILKERHQGYGNIIFIDGHVESQLWQEYVNNIPDQGWSGSQQPAAGDFGKRWTQLY
jgi:prepilin-type N-terminal cleavage/methylation domain-containing protein/prepilin-type processing-associated H-X9-DG protein